MDPARVKGRARLVGRVGSAAVALGGVVLGSVPGSFLLGPSLVAAGGPLEPTLGSWAARCSLSISPWGSPAATLGPRNAVVRAPVVVGPNTSTPLFALDLLLPVGPCIAGAPLVCMLVLIVLNSSSVLAQLGSNVKLPPIVPPVELVVFCRSLFVMFPLALGAAVLLVVLVLLVVMRVTLLSSRVGSM